MHPKLLIQSTQNSQGPSENSVTVLTLGCGTIKITAPRVRDDREGRRFTSEIFPPYLRKSAKVENLLPIIYLKGSLLETSSQLLWDFSGKTLLRDSHRRQSQLLGTQDRKRTE